MRAPGQETRLTLLGLLVAATTAGPAAATPPNLSAPRFLTGDAILAPAHGNQRTPEIAASNDGFLAVWADDRTAITSVGISGGGPAFDHHIGSMWDIYAARLDAAGNLVDQTPIIVAQQIQNQGLLDVAWNGQNWLVVFSGEQGMQCCPEEHRFVVRISPAGAVLDNPPIRIDAVATFDNYWPPAVGSDGVNWLVVGMDRSLDGSFAVRGLRIGPDGTILDPAGVVLASGGYPGDFDVVFSAGQYFLVWSDGGMTSGGRILGQRLSRELAPIGGRITVNPYNPTQGLNCRVASDGTDYFVAWWENRYNGWSQLMGARVTGSGVVLDPSGLALTAAYGYTNYEPAVVWNGANYVVAYDRDFFPAVDLLATRVTPSGRVLDYDENALRVSTAAGTQLEAAIDRVPGGATLITWSDARYSSVSYTNTDIFGATLAANGAVGADRCVALGAPRQTHLRLVPSGTDYLAVFRSETSPETRIAAQRVDASGAVMDPEPVVVAQGGAKITNPTAAWTGTEYLVVWEDAGTNRIYGRRLAPDLTMLDPTPIELLRGNTPDVAALNGVFLVVASYEQPPENRLIYSQRVRGSDGAILDASPGAIGPDFSLYPRVTAFAGRWLVAWERHPTHDDPSTIIQANFVAASGVPGTYFVAGADGQLPAVAAGPDQALIAWEDADIGTSQLEIFVSRLRPDGSFLPTVQATAAPNSQFDAAITWIGSQYLVSFGDHRNDDVLESHRGDLFGTLVGEDGTLPEPNGFAVASDTIPEMFPHVAANGTEFMIGGSVFRQAPGYVAYRIALRALTGPVAVGEPPEGLGRPTLAISANPVIGPATILLRGASGKPATVTVCDVAGRTVRRLFEGVTPRETLRLDWDVRDPSGRPLDPGVYFVSARTPDGASAMRVVVLQ